MSNTQRLDKTILPKQFQTPYRLLIDICSCAQRILHLILMEMCEYGERERIQNSTAAFLLLGHILDYDSTIPNQL